MARGGERAQGAVFEPWSGNVPVPCESLQQQRDVERNGRYAGVRDSSDVVPDELVLRAVCGCVYVAAVGGVSTASAATGGSVQHASGRTSSRTHPGCSRPARHPAAKFSGTAATDSGRHQYVWLAPGGRTENAGTSCRSSLASNC